MDDNVLKFPTIGRAITLEDQGVYFTMNPQTSRVHSIFRLDYEDGWYLHQLQKMTQEDEYGWVLMAAHVNDVLKKMTAHEIRHHFAKLELLQLKGAWQVLRNQHFGFGKFTPSNLQEERFALMPFVDNVMRMPILLVKADDATLQQVKATLGKKVEFA